MITLARCQELANQIAKEYGYKEQKVVFGKRLSKTWGMINKRTGKITLNFNFCMSNTEDIVYDLLKHEFAHLNPEACGHDKVFGETCRSMGISEHTYIDHPEASNTMKYEYVCPVCGHIAQYNYKKVISCGICFPGRYNDAYRMIMRENTILDKINRTNIRRRNLR